MEGYANRAAESSSSGVEGFSLGRGDFDRGGFSRGRGRFSRGRSSFQRDRGGLSRGQNSFQKDRGGFSRGQSSFQKDRGGLSRGQSGFQKDRGGFSRGQSSFQNDRGGLSRGHVSRSRVSIDSKRSKRGKGRGGFSNRRVNVSRWRGNFNQRGEGNLFKRRKFKNVWYPHQGSNYGDEDNHKVGKGVRSRTKKKMVSYWPMMSDAKSKHKHVENPASLLQILRKSEKFSEIKHLFNLPENNDAELSGILEEFEDWTLSDLLNMLTVMRFAPYLFDKDNIVGSEQKIYSLFNKHKISSSVQECTAVFKALVNSLECKTFRQSLNSVKLYLMEIIPPEEGEKIKHPRLEELVPNAVSLLEKDLHNLDETSLFTIITSLGLTAHNVQKLLHPVVKTLYYVKESELRKEFFSKLYKIIKKNPDLYPLRNSKVFL